MNVNIVPLNLIDPIWPRIADGLHVACLNSGGDITAAELWQRCRNGSAFLVLVHEGEEILGASVWCYEEWTTGPKLRCLALYGRDLRRWIKPLREAVLVLMRNCGAKSLVAEGLDKWTPLFRRMFPNAKKLRALYEEEFD